MKGKMKAAVLYGLKDIKVNLVDIPTISDNEALIKVKYAGICGSDIPRSMITGARKYPIILGHEFSGEVVETGNRVKKVKNGDRVVVAPLIGCGECVYCRSGHYGLCDNYNIIGTGSDGAFAEYVKVPENNILKINDKLSFKAAAGIEPATIGYHALEKAGIKPGETVVIMGCGSIGQLTIQWAKIFGASTVIGVDISNEKLNLAKNLGCDIIINSSETNVISRINEITNGGADAVIETAGSPVTQQQSILSTKKMGHTIFVGITNKDLSLDKETVDRVLRGEITIQGSWNSYTAPYPGAAWSAAIDFMSKGKINFDDIVSHIINLEDVMDYLKGMADHSIEYNKVLICLDE